MFSHRRYARPKLAIITAGAAGLVAAGIAGAGPASADQVQDDQYFAALQQIYPGRDLVLKPNIDNAHRICDQLGRGNTFDAVANELHDADHNKSTLEQAQREVNLAKSTYCP